MPLACGPNLQPERLKQYSPSMKKPLSSRLVQEIRTAEVGRTSPSPSASADLPIQPPQRVECAFGRTSLEPDAEGDPAALSYYELVRRDGNAPPSIRDR